MLRQTVCRCIWTRACLCVCVGGKLYWYKAIVKQWRKGSLSQWGQTSVDLICDFTHKDHSEESQSHPSAPHTYINFPQNPPGNLQADQKSSQTPAAGYCGPRARTFRRRLPPPRTPPLPPLNIWIPLQDPSFTFSLLTSQKRTTIWQWLHNLEGEKNLIVIFF